MCRSCGIVVICLVKYCEGLFTGLVIYLKLLDMNVNKEGFFHRILAANQRFNSQILLVLSPLFEQVFYPVSTAPIIIRTK